MLQFWWHVDGVERCYMRVDVPSGFAAAWSGTCEGDCALLAASRQLKLGVQQ